MKGQWIIVTGGNRGLGYDVCHKLAKSGRPVVLCSRDKQAGKEAASRIESDVGSTGRCICMQLDVSDSKSVKSFIAEVAESFDQQIYGLINNAGIYPDGWTEKIFRNTMRVNFLSPMDLAIGIAPLIVKGGRIVNVTSGLGGLSNLSPAYKKRVAAAESIEELRSLPFDLNDKVASGFKPTYCLTKAMINRAAQLLSQHPDFSHISINAADPGWCRTDMGGAGASRTVSQGSDSLLAVLNFPENVTGGVFIDGRQRTL